MSVLRCGTRATEPLVQCLRHGDAEVRAAAVDLLGWLGAVDCAPALRDEVTRGPAATSAAASEALVRIGLEPPATVG
jgi:HEAT repeat protein